MTISPSEAQQLPAADRLDLSGCRIEPGRVNAHTHLYSGLAPLGLPAPKPAPRSFLKILERIWWRLDRALDESSLRAAARLYVAEALLAGTTSLIDHHESPNLIEGSLDILADVCHDLGARAVLTYGATERNGGRDEARRGLAECRRFLESNRRPLVTGVIGLHASFTVSDATVEEAAHLARDLGAVLHLHAAEDKADVVDALKRGYPGPLQRFLERSALPAGSILAHGVHLAHHEVELAAEHGIWIVQNPRSNRGNRVGYPKWLRESRRVALGTDGFPADMTAEARALMSDAELNSDDMETVRWRIDSAWGLLTEQFGMSFAPLPVGEAGDWIAVEPILGPDGALPPADGPLDLSILAGGRVRHVVVGGRLVVENGTLKTADIDEIRARAREEAPKLWARMEGF